MYIYIYKLTYNNNIVILHYCAGLWKLVSLTARTHLRLNGYLKRIVLEIAARDMCVYMRVWVRACMFVCVLFSLRENQKRSWSRGLSRPRLSAGISIFFYTYFFFRWPLFNLIIAALNNTYHNIVLCYNFVKHYHTTRRGCRYTHTHAHAHARTHARTHAHDTKHFLSPTKNKNV